MKDLIKDKCGTIAVYFFLIHSDQKNPCMAPLNVGWSKAEYRKMFASRKMLSPSGN